MMIQIRSNLRQSPGALGKVRNDDAEPSHTDAEPQYGRQFLGHVDVAARACWRSRSIPVLTGDSIKQVVEVDGV